MMIMKLMGKSKMPLIIIGGFLVLLVWGVGIYFLLGLGVRKNYPTPKQQKPASFPSTRLTTTPTPTTTTREDTKSKAVKFCAEKNTSEVDVAGDKIKVVSKIPSVGSTYYLADGRKIGCPVVSPNSETQECKQLSENKWEKVCYRED